MADIITAPRVRNGYPTEKPVSVSEVLIEQSTKPGELVIDPFMGSASAGEAAYKLARRFAGCDLKQSAVDLARARLAGKVSPE